MYCMREDKLTILPRDQESIKLGKIQFLSYRCLTLIVSTAARSPLAFAYNNIIICRSLSLETAALSLLLPVLPLTITLLPSVPTLACNFDLSEAGE